MKENVEPPSVCEESNLRKLIRKKGRNPQCASGTIDLSSTQDPTCTNTSTTPEALKELDDITDFPDPAKLKNLFGRPEFSGLDGLNEYDDDFAVFVDRSGILTHEMKRSIARSLANQNASTDISNSATSLSEVSESDQSDIPTGYSDPG